MQIDLEPADQLVARIVGKIAGKLSITAQSATTIALLVNNLGGTSGLEMAVVSRAAVQQFEAIGANIARVYMGSFVTSIAMAGVSLTAMVLGPDDSALAFLDAPTTAFAWPSVVASLSRLHPEHIQSRSAKFSPGQKSEATTTQNSGPQTFEATTDFALKLGQAIQTVAQALVACEKELTTLDTIVGDGDCGITMSDAGKHLLEMLEGSRIPLDSAPDALLALSHSLSSSMGGSSGAIYAILLSATGAALASRDWKSDPVAWGHAISIGIDAVSTYGGAKLGDRTVLDALMPACASFISSAKNGEELSKCVLAASESAQLGAEGTANLTPRAGRANYIDPKRVIGTPDPGAVAVARWVAALSNWFLVDDK